ncbi:hypothetical protein [Butyrivibrio sp.]|uniref:hypothetical protein n=1 Tax=Butyrivibrio sp. TaxID=28121 RepID=UPI0025C1F3B3|nr:hypothetical protein [Butyrivibrio sp.]
MGNWGDLEKRKKEKALGIWARDSESLFRFVGGQQYDKKTLFSGNYKICIGIIDVDGASFLAGRNYSLL